MDQTKEQLLKYFQGLGTSTLQKLQKYSKLLIVPDEDMLTAATMSQMVDRAHTLADSLFPEWTDRSKSDFGEFLVELFALFSEKDFWYINAFANEGILRKMRSYSNAFSKASSMGYSPILCKGATTNFNVTFASGEATTYERGDLVVEVTGVKFTNDEMFRLSNSATETTHAFSLAEGSHIAEDVTYNGYNIFLRKENIDVDSLKVVIDNIVYERVKNFGFSGANSNHFMVLPEEDGSCSIYFGSNGFGIQPPIGKAVRVEYRKCSGAEGNIPIDLAKVNEDISPRKATAVVMLAESSGGTLAESLTSIKENAPLFFSTKRAAINETVTEEILNSLSFVHKSKVEVVGREVVYRIIPASGYLEPSSSEILSIEKEVYPYLMAGYEGKNSPNSYKNLLTVANASASAIILDTIISPGYDQEVIESSLRQVMSDVTNPLIKANYGGTFSKTDVDVLMRSSIAGVQSVTFKLKIGTNEQVMPDISLEPTEIFRTISQDTLIVRINVL